VGSSKEGRMTLDPHGQPLSGYMNRARRTERDLSEMLGLAKGMLADGIVNDEEARFLSDWGLNHPDALVQWPVNLIFTRLHQFFADGRIDERERVELNDLLAQLVGGTASLLLGYEGATTLPLDVPPPSVVWPDQIFVFTGQFAYGTREDCETEVTSRGGVCDRNVTLRTSFLVIGTFGSEDWAHSSFGRKIEKAMDLRRRGVPSIRIVGEDHWATALSATV
jgi:NAD-dependent DNA ligase